MPDPAKAALDASPVSYEDLAEMEKQFDDAETEIIRQQVVLTAPLYKKRDEMVSKINNFWPLVIENAPQDIDQYIQPSDSQVLGGHLTRLWIENFEIVNSKVVDGGDPRSLSFTFEFSENEWFTNTKLEKKFWYRRASDGWCGLVSEPVKIDWKAGKDLTEGLLDLAVNLYAAEQAKNQKKLEAAQKAMEKKMEQTGMGAVSFFAFFGYIGRRISAADSVEANKREAKIRAGEKVEDIIITEEQEDREDMEAALEIFQDGDDLAIAIGEDLWPSAIKYFSEPPHGDGCQDDCCGSDDEDHEHGHVEEESDSE